MRVRLYSRLHCGLCDEARTVILTVRGEVPFEFEEVLIDGDDTLERDYGIRIPVVVVDGREEFEIRVDGERLRALVSARNRRA
jgi:Glutaredoxin-like domain (DUF836)